MFHPVDLGTPAEMNLSKPPALDFQPSEMFTALITHTVWLEFWDFVWIRDKWDWRGRGREPEQLIPDKTPATTWWGK